MIPLVVHRGGHVQHSYLYVVGANGCAGCAPSCVSTVTSDGGISTVAAGSVDMWEGQIILDGYGVSILTF